MEPLTRVALELRYALDLLGIAVFAVSGALAAGRKQLDLLGVVVLALVTAIGGGTIRDVLLARYPLFWLTDPTYLLVILVAALATVGVARLWPVPERSLLIADGLGLALFSVAGAQIAEQAGLPTPGVVLLGTVTGVAGGAVRDVLSGEIPVVLRRGNLYASAAIVGTAVYRGLEALDIDRTRATLAGMAVVAALRFAAIAWRLTLPQFTLPANHSADR
ncbi:MAG: trimeric intracellular cation channel family protein [Gemmatimonadaceae bacterium]